MFILVIVFIFVFIYLENRINKIEKSIESLKRNSSIVNPVSNVVVPNVVDRVDVKEDVPVPKPIPQVITPQFETRIPTPAQVKLDSENTEFNFGSKIITGVGIFAVVLGIGFFLRYAFDSGLITVGMRLFLGFLSGLVCIVAGHYFTKKYSGYGLRVIGLGLALWYVTAYAAFGFYQVVTEPISMLFSIIITIIGVSLALFYNSESLIKFALLGGFIVPLIFTGVDSITFKFLYLIILNISILVIARFKTWPGLTLFGIIPTFILTLILSASDAARSMKVEVYSYLTIIFAIYFVSSVKNLLYKNEGHQSVNALLSYIIPVFYFICASPLLSTKDDYALLAFIIGIFYVIVSAVFRVMFKDYKDGVTISGVMLSIGSTFLLLATTLHFKGRTLDMTLIAEAIILVVTGYLVGSVGNRIIGLFLAIIMAFKISATNYVFLPGVVAIFNTRAVSFAFATLMFGVIWYIYRFAQSDFDQDEKKFGSAVSALGLFIVPFIWINFELFKFNLENAFRLLPLTWALYALVFTSLSFFGKELILRILSYVVLFASLCLMVSGLWVLPADQYILLFNIRFLTVLVVLVVLTSITAMIRMHKDELYIDETDLLKPFYIAINGILLWGLSLEVVDYYEHQMGMSLSSADEYKSLENAKRVVLSIVWLIYASVAMAIGIVKRITFVRQLSIALLAVTVFKIFLYDTTNLDDIYRFISFITLGVILLLVGFSYHRFKDRIIELVGVEPKKTV